MLMLFIDLLIFVFIYSFIYLFIHVPPIENIIVQSSHLMKKWLNLNKIAQIVCGFVTLCRL